MAKFDNWFLRPIQGFTQSKIEKAKIIADVLNICILPMRIGRTAAFKSWISDC